MSFRQELMKHLTALPVTDVKKLVSKYNKELDIKPISKLKKAEILQKIKDKKPMDKQLLAKLTNEARAKREGKKAQKASEKEAAKKPVEKFGTEKKKIKVKKAKPDFLDLDKDGDKKEPMKKAAKEAKKSKPKPMAKEDAKALAEAFAKAPEEEKGSLFSDKKEESELSKKRKEVMKVYEKFKDKLKDIPIEGLKGEPKSAPIFLKDIKEAKTIRELERLEGSMITIHNEGGSTTVFGKKPRSGLHIYVLSVDPDDKDALIRQEIRWSEGKGKKPTPKELEAAKKAFEKRKKNKKINTYLKMALMDGSKLIDFDRDKAAINKFEKDGKIAN